MKRDKPVDWSTVPKWQAPSFEFRRGADGTWLARVWHPGLPKKTRFVKLTHELIEGARKEYGAYCYGGQQALQLLEEHEND